MSNPSAARYNSPIHFAHEVEDHLFQELPFLAAGGILCFTPLTLYLFWLSSVNRGDRPAVVSGVWDFVALLAGLSGFILCAGCVLTLLSTNAGLFKRGGFAEIQKAWADAQLLAAVTPIAYALLIVLSAAVTLRLRRRNVVVYNVHLPSAEQVVTDLFAKLNIDAKRTGNLWSHNGGLIEMSVFHIFSHVTLRLLPPDLRVREEFEREIRAAMPRQAVGDNPAGPWLMSAAVSCFITTVSCVILTFVAAYQR